MKYFISILLSVILFVNSYGQNNTCPTATPYIDNQFIPFTPPTNWVQLYRTFQSPGISIDFSYRPFSELTGAGVAICPNIDIFYELWDQNCNLIEFNSTGAFTNLIPGNRYVVGFLASCTSAGIGFIITGEDIILPVRLVTFTAKPTFRGIDLTWSTASEANSMGFKIERSTDLSNWLDIGFVTGAGYSNRLVEYKFEDTRPIRGVNYYRLIQIDNTGDLENLQTIAILWNENVHEGPFKIYNILGQKTK